MIYKKPGVYLMNKLRVIHLFEADYNLIIGTIFGRQAMYSGVDQHTLHLSQWSQPGRQCADVVVMRQLTLATAKMTKTPLAGFENDASACYDRIVMNLVAAVFDRMGVPPGPLRLQKQTLLHVVHFLKSGFGTSVNSYTSDALHRIFGIGQGSKAGPVSWTAVSSLLFEAQDILGTGLEFKNPADTIRHRRHSDGFVDDTTGYHSKEVEWLRHTPTTQTVFEGLKKDAHTWERLLWTSGGLLELSKCKFYIAYWTFDADGVGRMLTKDELDTPPLLLTEGDTGNLQTIRIATDNMGLIARIQLGLEAKTVFAGAALCSDYDVVNELVISTKRLPIRLTWEHVKGHQDNRKKWYKLTWMETLNVRANVLATEALNLPGSPVPAITMIPSSKIALQIKFVDISSHYTTHLRKAASQPATLLHF
jgi:hypothetical protein